MILDRKSLETLADAEQNPPTNKFSFFLFITHRPSFKVN